ncbi:MAG: tetratricopeptide repeat protein [Pseudobdellovibrionaceae bacterium]
MKKIALYLSLPLFVTSSQMNWAQAKTNNSKAKPAANQTQRKKTVGELLKQADRGGAISSATQKKDTALPETKDLFGEKKVQNVNLNQIKPPKTSTFFEESNTDKAKLEKITDQQINELFKLTQKFRNSPQRGELWLRLAELYVEKAGVIDYRKQGEYDQALKDFQAGKRKTKPALDLRDAKEYNKKAIQLYEWFARDFPKDDKMDQALFFLGYNYYELGKLDQGTAYYTRLTKEFPQSPYVIEANFALAEYHFENEKWKEAEGYYSQVLRYRRHRLYNFSLYKTAWCEFRSGNTQRALKTMELLIRTNKEQAAQAALQGRKNISKTRLENEGLRDLVVFYADIGEPEKAPGYFNALAGQNSMNYVEKLAYLYADKGNLSGARYLFNYLIEQNPTSPKAFDYKYQVVRLYSNAKKSREFREEMFAWIRNFGTGSAWYQANQANKDFVDNSYKLREQTLRTYVLQQHQTAQNSRAPFSQSLALEGYKLYLNEFKDAQAVADMHFYYGELLYDLKKFDEAGAQYRWVVENGKGSKFYSRAAENTVLALEKDLPSDDEMAAKVGKSVEPIPLDPRVERFIEVAKDYVNRLPDTEKAVEMKFRIGRLYYQHNQFDQAIPYFKDIVAKNSKSRYGEYSANLLLDIYNLKKDYAGLEKTGSELLAVPGIAGSKAGADIKGVLEKASFKRAQDLEVAKDYAGSAQQFEVFAKQNPTSPLAVSAIFNSAINYERAGINHKAVSAHQVVLNSKDKAADPLKVKSRRILPKLLQDSGQLEEAASAYKAAAIEAGKDPLAPNLFFNAAVLYEAVGKNSEAIRNYETFYDKAKKSDRVEALYQMATLYRKQGSLTKASEKYQDYVNMGSGSQERIVESAFWIHDISRRMNRVTLSDEWKKKTLSLQRRYAPNKKGPGATYAARIKLAEANEVFAELKRIRIPQNPAAQQKAAQQKIAFVTRLNNELGDVVKYDSADEIVGALSILGQANLHMGDSLMNAPLPAGLNAEETKQYKAGIEKLAQPFYDKAKDSLKAAVERGSELDVFNEAYHKARQLALRLDPKMFYEGSEVALETIQGSWGQQ